MGSNGEDNDFETKEMVESATLAYATHGISE
jgi:hypothetical protein